MYSQNLGKRNPYPSLSLLWEEESSLSESPSLINKLISEVERKERGMQRNKQTRWMNLGNQGSDSAAGRCFSHTSIHS